VSRLGDVFGTTVNVAARLTSVARPGSVVVDRGMHDALSPPAEDVTPDDGPTDPPPAGSDDDDADERDTDTPSYRLRRIRRVSVKGFSRLEAWSLRRPRGD
jgi:adenylate cyclase